MKARLRNGKILTGKIAKIFIEIGVAEPVEDKPKVIEQKEIKPKHTKKAAPKRRGRPSAKKK